MPKIIFKIILLYIILSALVSGCSLMGDYAVGFGDIPISVQEILPMEEEKGENSLLEPPIEPNDQKKGVELYMCVIISPNIIQQHINKNQPTSNVSFPVLLAEMPKNLMEIAFNELKKRKQFSPIQDMRGITLFDIIKENELYFNKEVN